MSYRIVDIENWERRDLFKLYTTSLKLVMNITVEMDVTHLRAFCRERGLRFYPTMIWAVSRVINSREEFRYRIREDGTLILYDYVSPSYTDFNPETEKFVKFVTEYSEDLEVFHERAVRDMAAHKNEVGFLPDQPENFFDISCLPWTAYQSMTLHVDDGKISLFPVVIWGKYEEKDGRTVMPVTLNVHHAVADGFHASRFFNDLQNAINAL